MPAYYNEIEPYAAAWLRSLIGAGHIPAGDVDERDIRHVSADDLKPYTQCHFFAGIGGWAYALRLAGWADDRPVWTGSCPCQPFSVAGKKSRQQDERHLWPTWRGLIAQSKPATIFGEQVASAVTAGWWDDVASDLEAEGYAGAAAILPACSVGQPQRRDRLWFVAKAASDRGNQQWLSAQGEALAADIIVRDRQRQNTGDVADTECATAAGGGISSPCGSSGVHGGEPAQKERSVAADMPGDGCYCYGSLGNAEHNGLFAEREFGEQEEKGRVLEPERPGIEFIECPDGKIRAVKSGLRLLAHGVPARVGRLRAYGNAIVPQVAAEFIRATM